MKIKQCRLLVFSIVFFLVFSMSLLQSACAAEERFVDLSDGTVRDQETGLMWASQDNGTSIIWSAAVEYCKQYSAGGYKDWRMPTSGELAALYGAKKKVEGEDYEATIDLVTKSIQVTAPWVWSSRRLSNNKAVAFGYNYGVTRRLFRGNGVNRRVLPVRSVP